MNKKFAQTMSLEALEKKIDFYEERLMQMEQKGLEGSEQYQQLSQELEYLNEQADQLAGEKTSKEERQKQEEEAREEEQRKLREKEKYEEKKKKVEKAWNKLEEEEWFRKVRTNYPYEQVAPDTWKVESKAREWDAETPRTWYFDNETDAREKVLSLIYYRYYDYFLREGERGKVQRPPREIQQSLKEDGQPVITAKKSQEWINKKTKHLIEEEGYNSDQAYAIANDMAKESTAAQKAVRNAQKAINSALGKRVTAEEDGKPDKVVEIADAIRRDSPSTSDEQAYRMAWETYCSYVNPSYEGCTERGKSKRESPKEER